MIVFEPVVLLLFFIVLSVLVGSVSLVNLMQGSEISMPPPPQRERVSFSWSVLSGTALTSIKYGFPAMSFLASKDHLITHHTKDCIWNPAAMMHVSVQGEINLGQDVPRSKSLGSEGVLKVSTFNKSWCTCSGPGGVLAKAQLIKNTGWIGIGSCHKPPGFYCIPMGSMQDYVISKRQQYCQRVDYHF